MASKPIESGQRQAVSYSIADSRRNAGRALIAASTLFLAAIILFQSLYSAGLFPFGFETWRPVLYAFVLWGVALGAGQVLMRGEAGHRALFVLPAVLFTIAMVVFPTFFGLYIAFTDWNLSSFEGRRFNGLANFWAMLADPYY